MKTLIEGKKDYTVKHGSHKILKDGNNKILWVDEQKNIAHTTGSVAHVKFYEPITNDDNTTYTYVELSVEDIKKLHAAIIEIENQRFEEFID